MVNFIKFTAFCNRKPMIIQFSVKINRFLKEFCNFITMPKNGVMKLSDMYNRIEELCKDRGISITQMCRDADVTRANLTELKKGRTLKLSANNLDKISAYFGVSADFLMGREQQKTPAPEKDEREYSDQALLDAFNRADEATKAAIRLLLKVE